MKKLIATIICLMALSVTAIPAGAQTRSRITGTRSSNSRSYYNGNRSDVYRGYRYDGRDRSVWDEHRDKLTTAGGAVAGALLGGLVGGKKGAIIGALAGGGGAALYTYKIRNDNNGRRRF